MDQFSKILSELLQLNWRNAFALCAAAASVLAFRAFGHLQDASEFWIAFGGVFGFWILIALAVDQIKALLKKHLRRRRLKAAHNRALAANALRDQTNRDKAVIATEAEKSLAVKNLGYVRDWETETLLWIYHRGGRARASIHHSGIDGLYKFKILAREDQKADWTDCMWLIPEHVARAIEEKIGAPDIQKAKGKAPWLNRTRI